MNDREDLGNGEAVERAGGGQRVGAHVLENEPVADVEDGQFDAGGDAVQAVARRAPDGGCVQRTRARLEHLRRHLLVVVEHAVERAVDAIVDVVHVRQLGLRLGVVAQLAPAVDARGQRECRRHVVAARLGDDVHAAALGEVLIQRRVDDVGRLRQRRAAPARIAAAEVDQIQRIAVLGRQVEQVASHGQAATEHLHRSNKISL